MEQEKVEEEINHIKQNLLFFSKYWNLLIENPKSRKAMMTTIDRLLDRLIILLKLRK
ncbi:hypothetical protein [Dysgonomonas sp. 520]|uniref:hypothetical protein n=1 Tax=Dysgonomonas sp. 520 TaxID=2302931 RepID=UPI0013D1603F|nr:hypothetical protein [Dysgonomonas sp. 520]